MQFSVARLLNEARDEISRSNEFKSVEQTQ